MSNSCMRCKRPLSDPASKERGYGPICWARVQAERDEGENMQDQQFINEPMDEYIILERRPDGCWTNVPRLVRHHSPTGYEWGYGGSGPSDLALNIIENVLRMTNHIGATTGPMWDKSYVYQLASTLHQSFKWEFLANLPREGGRIYTNDVILWIREHSN